MEQTTDRRSRAATSATMAERSVSMQGRTMQPIGRAQQPRANPNRTQATEQKPQATARKPANDYTITLRSSDLEEIQSGPSVLSWFITLMILSIPIVNIVYCFVLVISRSQKRRYATAWLIANILFMSLVIIISLILLNVAVEFGDSVLEYMEML